MSDGRLQTYNAAEDILSRHAGTASSERLAVIDSRGSYSYSAVERRVNQFANLLKESGIQMEQRVLLCLDDSIDFVTCFLGAIKAGVVPIPTNTLLKAADYEFMLADSRARCLVVSGYLIEQFSPHIESNSFLVKTLVSGEEQPPFENLEQQLAGMPETFTTAPTRAEEVAFWLYTSGTTGHPKAVMHRQNSLVATAEHFGRHVLDLKPDDIVFSPPKMFFAYGLGNSLTFPLCAGACSMLYPDRPTPDAVAEFTQAHPPTVFFAVPTLYSMMLNKQRLPDFSRMRLCISAGEALPVHIFERWKETTGLEILDGLGSTEMLNTFLSNRLEDNRPGTSGKPVPGYELRILNESGVDAADGEMGDLYVSGPSSAAGYWNLRAQSAETFQGAWVYTRDKYIRDPDGYYQHCGRSDDMLKVGGIYVAPTEVEQALLEHEAVAEAAVVGAEDSDKLIKPRAFVVLAESCEASPSLESELISFVRGKLADFKRPRWIQFVSEIPKTTTGKLQRHKLR